MCTSSPRTEDLLEHRLVGDVGEHPQLDLRVVGADQHVAGVGLEAAADLAARAACGSGRSGGWGWSRRAGRSARPPAGTSCGCARARRPATAARRGRSWPSCRRARASARSCGITGCSSRIACEHARVGREAGLAAALARQRRASRTGSRPSCWGEPITNSSPLQVPDLALERARPRRVRACVIAASRSPCRAAPRSMLHRRAGPRTSGSSTSSISAVEAALGRSARAAAPRALPSAPRRRPARPRAPTRTRAPRTARRAGKPRRAGSSR